MSRGLFKINKPGVPSTVVGKDGEESGRSVEVGGGSVHEVGLGSDEEGSLEKGVLEILIVVVGPWEELLST